MAYTFKHGDRPIEGYTIQRAVGRGGFGEVYYAISDGGREVAVKYLRDNPQVELRGVSHCINLKSPHLVSIFDVKKTVDGEYAIIMEYCSGPSLRDLLIAEPKGFAPEKAAFFVREIAKGLAYLHDRGIVHRDLKPGNIFYDDGYVKIGDYGLSKFISVSRHSGQTASVGTVHYMAPEIGSGNYSKGVDIYALGVILYEMLLGRVPFEGSSMAEVLMKHLTAQPELDELPQPFGRVIRKCLEKNPADRYQTVDEMVEELLEVETVRESLAGFSAKSLEGAVRRGTPERLDSPIPSPNFDTPRGPAYPGGAVEEGTVELPRKVGKRLNRISRKVDAKLDRLAARDPRPKAASAGQRHQPLPPRPGDPFQGVDRKKRILLSGLLSLGLAVGLGVLVGSTHTEEEGVAAGMLVALMPLSMLLGRSAVGWFGVAYGPIWSQRLILLCCAAPLMAIGAAPLFEGSERQAQAGAGLWLGLLAVIVFTNWEKTLEEASSGDMSFGTAFSAAIKGLICVAIASAIVTRGGQKYMFIGAGVAGAASLVLQATAWWLPAQANRAARRLGYGLREPSPDSHAERPPPPRGKMRSQEWQKAGVPEPPMPPLGAHFRYDIDEESAGWDEPTLTPASSDGALEASSQDTGPQRWMVTRAFWGLVAFILMGAAIVTFLFPLITVDLPYKEKTAALVMCVLFSAGMIFALRKTTPVRRGGFWRDTLRPFLISACLFGVGATIIGIARHWHLDDFSDESRAIILTKLVLSSVLLLFLVFGTGRTRRPPRPFVQPGEESPEGYPSGGHQRRAHDEGAPESAEKHAVQRQKT